MAPEAASCEWSRRRARVTTFASGLPPAIPEVGIGGAIDVAFAGGSAYVLVTLVGPVFGQTDVVNGIYRIEKDGTATAIADIGAWSITILPRPTSSSPAASSTRWRSTTADSWSPTGTTTACCASRAPVTSARRSRSATSSPRASRSAAGRSTWARPARSRISRPNGKVVTFTPNSAATELASGASLIVDVEFGPGRRLYALSQGSWDLPPTPENEGAPASPDTGRLLRVTRDGSFASVVERLDRPTSVDFIGKTAFVVTLTGKVIRIDNAGRAPFDEPH